MAGGDWFDAFVLGAKHIASFPDRETFIYCVSEGPGSPVKIGITENVSRRFRALQVHTWRPLRIEWQVPGLSIHEVALKHILAARRISGEWFEDPEDEVKSLSVAAGAEHLVRQFGALHVAIARAAA